jgi:hypothetical protein
VSDRLYGGEDLIRLLRETEYLHYSTTSGTNAVVERKGTPVELLVDSGAEEDVYGISELVDAELWQAMVPHPSVGIAVGADESVDLEAFHDRGERPAGDQYRSDRDRAAQRRGGAGDQEPAAGGVPAASAGRDPVHPCRTSSCTTSTTRGAC